MAKKKIGPFLAGGIGDAYGAGFEYAPPEVVTEFNTLKGYRKHHKYDIPLGAYTDDTQMALGLAHHIIWAGFGVTHWTPSALVSQWLRQFKQDPRIGYAGHFYDFLLTHASADLFLRDIAPHSNKSGGAMRAWPVGFCKDTGRVVDLAMFQASITHATRAGMTAAAAAALMFHYCYWQSGPKADLPLYLDKALPGFDFLTPWEGPVGAEGISAVKAALRALVEGDGLGPILKQCVAFTGDVDTVAAIAMPAAAVCSEVKNSLPKVLIDGLEDGDFGRKYLILHDIKFAKSFPR